MVVNVGRRASTFSAHSGEYISTFGSPSATIPSNSCTVSRQLRFWRMIPSLPAAKKRSTYSGLLPL